MSSKTNYEPKVDLQGCPDNTVVEEGTSLTPPSSAEHMLPPAKTANSETHKPLCGYLMKQSAKLPIKTWKPRWFVFDEKRCCLFYYSEKNNINPQGKIDISTATLAYEIENRSKNQFEILSEGRTTSLQASSNEAMMYWLTQLQDKRRKFSSKRQPSRNSMETDQLVLVDLTSGLVGASGSQENLLSPDDEATPLNNPLAPSNAPVDLEDKQAFTSEQPSIHGRTFSKLFKLKSSPNFPRRPHNKASIKEEAEQMVNGNSPSEEGQSSVNSEPSQSHESRPFRMNRKSMGSFFRRPDNVPCTNCQKLQESVSILENNLEIKEREVRDRDEINEFLRTEIRMGDMRDQAKKDLVQSAGDSQSDKTVDILLQREQTIEQLERLLEQAIGERDRASTELDAKRKEVEVLGEQVSLFKEALTAKDHVVVELTNKVFQLEHKGQLPTNPQDAMLPMTGKSYEEEIHKLEEMVDAYKQQNQFLSSELVELNAVRAEDRELYKKLESKHHELEAHHYRLESKYMVLLQEAQHPRMGLELGPDTTMVSQMLEEALTTDDKAPTVNVSSYDRYGFSHAHAASDAGYFADPLTVKARKLDQQAHRAKDDTAIDKRERWEALFGHGRDLQRSEDLKQLVRRGIPHNYRSKVWLWMIKQKLGPKYSQGYYLELREKYSGQPSIAVNQIELDLLRTLPTNKYYDSPDAQGIDKLRHVLVAFSWYNPEVGYCQGLNRLAAIALLFLDEEDAFWCLVVIVEHLLPKDYYSNTLLGSQTDQRVLMDLLQDHASKLYNHLSICDIDLSMITFNWFHTIFVDNLPVETMLRIWDTFLYEGSKVLFRFAIAIFKYNEEELLNIENSIGIFNRLRGMCQDATDVNRLAHIAFNEIGTFRMKTITTKRNLYKLEIQAELDALEQMRSSHAIPPPSARGGREATKEDKEDSGSELPLSPSPTSQSPSSSVRYAKREVTKDDKEKEDKQEEKEDSDSEFEEIIFLP